MRITAKAGNPFRARAQVLAAFVFQGDRKIAWKGSDPPDAFSKASRGPLSDFDGKKGETVVIYPEGTEASRVILVGLGKRSDFDPDVFRLAAGVAARRCRALGKRDLSAACPPGRDPAALGRAFAEGLELSSYSFDSLRTDGSDDAGPALRKAELFLADRKGSAETSREVKVGGIVARSANLVRDLGNSPSNHATPSILANKARQMARRRKIACRVLLEADMRKLGMGALLGVARGSREKPRFIILDYDGRKGRKKSKRGGASDGTVVLVGKGITFDSGGISLKPAQKMEEMKFDMCGGAAVIGTMDAIAQIGIPLRVVGLVPCTENLPGGSAQKPGDVVKSMSGKTIEVINTDAEGRLILADALAYAERYKPAAVIDLATLTGACIIALGHHAAALMGSDEKLSKALLRAGKESGERVWELPLWKEYRKQIESTVADVKNTGGRPAGTITAGLFLEEFVGEFPWAHLDIAGVAWTDSKGPIQGSGATGFGVRLLVQYLRDRAG